MPILLQNHKVASVRILVGENPLDFPTSPSSARKRGILPVLVVGRLMAVRQFNQSDFGSECLGYYSAEPDKKEDRF